MFQPGEYKTRDGHTARVYETNGRSSAYPIIGAVQEEDGLWTATVWRENGRFASLQWESDLDLVIPKSKIVVYININKSKDYLWTASHLSREASDLVASKDRIARVRVEFGYSPGQFDE